MKKFFIIAFTLLLSSVKVSAQVNWGWSKAGPSFNIESANANKTIMDSHGNTYVCGSFTVANGVQSDVFLAKYDVSGNIKWYKTASTQKIDQATGIGIDKKGNIYVTGFFGKQYGPPIVTDSIYFDSLLLPSTSGTADIFLAKYDSTGNCLWAKSMGSPLAHDQGLGLDVDDSGFVLITGFFGQNLNNNNSVTAIFDTIALNSNGAAGDIFIAKFNPNGQIVWANVAGGNGLDIGISIVTDTGRNVYVAGSFSNYAIFGGHSVNSISSGFYIGDGFIAKYSSNGSGLWVKPIGIIEDPNNPPSTGASLIMLDLAVNKLTSDVYITGAYDYGSITFDNGSTLPSISHYDIFLARFNGSGSLQWVRNAGSSSEDYGQGVATDNSGGVYLTGSYGYTIGFGNDTLSYAGGDDVYIVRYDTAGNVIWAKSMAGAGFESAMSIDVNEWGTSLCVAGFVNGAPLSFGPYTINASGASNYFVAKADIITGIKDIAATDPGISIFPNPSSGLLSFGNITLNTIVKITNLQGRIVYEGAVKTGRDLNLSYLPDGFYTVVMYGKTIQRNKLIIKH